MCSMPGRLDGASQPHTHAGIVKRCVGTVVAFLVSAAIAGCAARWRGLWYGGSCAEQVVALTHPTLEVVVLRTVVIIGRASIATCVADLPRLTDEVQSALGREFEEIIREEHFRMVRTCGGQEVSRAEAASFEERREAMIERFNCVIGASVVRRVDCEVDWVEGLGRR